MKDEEWTTVIGQKHNLLRINFREVFEYIDLLFLFVKRDIVTVYKQTILGPLWFIVQPVMTTIMFTFVFGKLANLSTDGAPHIVFYLIGITIWNYFSICLTATSNIFVANQGLFGKVYFPRVILPLSIVVSNLGKFLIQFCVFLIAFFYYWSLGEISPNIYLLLLPLIIAILALTSLGLGMLVSSLTTKYRDLTFLLGFGIQLLMYATPVIYPISSIPEKYAYIIELNPITPVIEFMRYGFLGVGSHSMTCLLYSFSFGILVFFFGLIVFNKVEKTFMDTV